MRRLEQKCLHYPNTGNPAPRLRTHLIGIVNRHKSRSFDMYSIPDEIHESKSFRGLSRDSSHEQHYSKSCVRAFIWPGVADNPAERVALILVIFQIVKEFLRCKGVYRKN